MEVAEDEAGSRRHILGDLRPMKLKSVLVLDFYLFLYFSSSESVADEAKEAGNQNGSYLDQKLGQE